MRGKSATAEADRKTKHEIRNTKYETNPNDLEEECSKHGGRAVWCFELCASNSFRISCFGFRISRWLMHLTITDYCGTCSLSRPSVAMVKCWGRWAAR